MAPRVWASSTRPAGDKLGLAVIGVAGQGLWNLQQLLKADASVVALCDVDERRAGEARAMCPRARFFVDFREMLDKAGRDIDAVLVATPDHTHAVATMAALRAGKHVYCEKPLTHSVWEARQVMAAARKYRRITQMGIQRHAGRNYRRVVELIQAGTIGAVREVHAWCPTVWSGKGTGSIVPEALGGVAAATNRTRPPVSPVPAGLHWDLWLGPAPQRPYADKAYVPAAWRGWWDFGGGGHADMACHFMDLVHWALELGHPAAVEAEGPPVDADSAPEWLTVRYEYPPRGDKPAVRLTWSVGPEQQYTGETPVPHPTGRMPVPQRLADWKEGVLFVGERGKLVADFTRFKLLSPTQSAESVPHSLPKSIGHHQEFITACKEGGTTSCNFDYAGVLTQAVLLGNVAYRSGRSIEWDPAGMTIPNAPQAEKYLRRPYRNGWEIPSL